MDIETIEAVALIVGLFAVIFIAWRMQMKEEKTKNDYTLRMKDRDIIHTYVKQGGDLPNIPFQKEPRLLKRGGYDDFIGNEHNDRISYGDDRYERNKLSKL